MTDDQQAMTEAPLTAPAASSSVLSQVPPVGWALVTAVLVGLLLVLLQWSRPVLVPILLAFYIGALSLPLYNWLLGHGLNKTEALLILIVVVVLGGVGLGALLLLGANRLVVGLSTYVPGLEAQLPLLQTTLADLGLNDPSIQRALSGPRVSDFMLTLLGYVVNIATDLFFSLVLVLFFVLEADRFLGLAQTRLHDRPLFGQLPAVGKTAVTYFGIRTRLNLFTGIGFTLVLLLLGVDYALLWGALAFVLSYIPYIGLTLAMLPPAILAFAEFGLSRAILVVLAALAINLAVENLLEPAYTGKKLQLSPTVVFISFFVWAWLLGPTGALLSMPITVLIMLVLQENEKTRWAAQLMSRGDIISSEAAATTVDSG